MQPAAAETWLAPDVPAVPSEIPLVRSRHGCYQGSQFSLMWLPDSASPGVELRTLDTSTTFAFPLGSFENLLLVTPYLRADDVTASAALDLPDNLYDTGVKFFWKRPVNDRWSSLVIVTPSVRSDFETSTDAFRLFGLGLMTWQWVPKKLAISGGAVWTGREDFPLLPAAGLLWTPTPEWKLDLQFPAPRLSRRVLCDPGCCETWVYLSGQIGGNTWAVTRPSGPEDVLTISDQRLNVGVERLWAGNRGVFAEAGIVFNRSVEYLSTPMEQELDSTIVLRAGVQF